MLSSDSSSNPRPVVAEFASSADELARRFCAVRGFSSHLAEPLVPEDMVVQSMPDASPTKWHLAHTSWFFETFLLKPWASGYISAFPQYNFLFNSYYNAVGERHCRAMRGVISRPTVDETRQYRAAIDASILNLLETADEALLAHLAPLIELGLHHEQQHQELLLTDIKHAFAQNPLAPQYRPAIAPLAGAQQLVWWEQEAGLYEVGHAGSGFAFDNEGPRHRVWLENFALSSHLVTNGQWLAFLEAGGYEKPEYWLSAGWATVQRAGWQAPLYWEKVDGKWRQFTLSGLREVDPDEPVTHVSFYEAEAYARFAGARLPTEFEWEVAAATQTVAGNFAESGCYHPVPEGRDGELFGNVWQWTRSQYSPYPGYAPAAGALGEYNGKFMSDQFVLRGGSCATSISHVRPTYRNFFGADARWQFSGVRLAR